jgi:hypothetical protein
LDFLGQGSEVSSVSEPRILKKWMRFTVRMAWVKDLDSSGTEQLNGKELMEEGLSISTPEHPGAKLLVYTEL